MKHLFIWLLWAVVIVGGCVAGDQILLHYSLDSPIYGAAQTFYKDFRGRFVQLVHNKDQHQEAAKGSWPPVLPPPALHPPAPEKMRPPHQSEAEPGGYVYTDKEGGLHLTTRLDEVPKAYRATAKPLKK